jgi:hypothetical protein
MRGVRAKARTSTALAAGAVLAALAAATVALSGCGASATLDPVARAADVTSKQGGARISFTMQFSSPALPGGFAIKANGYVDQRRRSGQMTMDMSGIPGLSALPGGGTGTIRLIFQYPVIYMNMPLLASRLPAGKTWLKLDIAKAAKSIGIDSSQFSSLNQTDPTQFLGYLRGSSGNVTTVGQESLHGVATTHYRATLELSKILEHLSGGQRDAAKGVLAKLGNANAIPVDVWVDGQDRLRRMQMLISTGAATGSSTGAFPSISGTITIDFTSYGPVPPIVPPPASEVFDASALAGAGLSGSGG